MQIDTAKIDEKIKKLQDLKRIASDPDMLKLLETLITDNGFKQPASTSAPTTATRTVPKKKASSKKGELFDAIKIALRSFDRRFTGAALVDQMRANGFIFVAENPSSAVNGPLRKLAKKGEIKVVSVGAGRTPSEYERVQKNSGD